MSGKLSERFAQIKKTVTGADRVEQGRKHRVQQTTQRQANQRGNQMNSRRGLNSNNNNNNQQRGNNSRTNSAVKINRPRVANRGSKGNNTDANQQRPQKKLQRRPNSAKTNNNANTGKKNDSRRGGKREKTEPVSTMDLDKQMASYWHKAGKGPDPDKMELDQQLEAYRTATTTAAAESS